MQRVETDPKKMPDVDLANRHPAFSRWAKTELCAIRRFSELWFLSIPKSSQHTQLFPTLSQIEKR